MSDTSQLVKGMTFDEVGRALPRWKHQPGGAILSPDKLHLFHTWDFIPPWGSIEKSLRLTFDNGRLIIWGEAASMDTKISSP